MELAAREPFVLLVVAVEALALAIRLPSLIAPDTWLALVAGRQVSTNGLPHHETLTIWAHGAHWVDQQWLGQLFMYGLQVVGGLRLVMLVHAIALVATFVLAFVFARRSGGSARSVALVGAVALFVAFPNSVARTQAFAFVLFVAVFSLLAQDSRTPTLRVFAVVPLLVLWANVHGSAVLGAGLVVVWGMAGVARAFRSPEAKRAAARLAGLVVAAPLCLLVSPYSFSLPGYYRSVIEAPAFRNFVTEWAPTTFPAQWPFFAFGAAALWVTARKASRLNLFEHLALLFTLVAGLSAVRNIVWFALVAMMVVPRALDGLWPPDRAPLRRRVNVALSAGAVAVVVGAFGVMAGGSLELKNRGYSRGALGAVARAAKENSSSRIFANEWYSDWLLWNVPELAGRVAFDARFELLSAQQIRSVADVRGQSSPHWLAATRGYRLLVLDPREEEPAIRSILRERGTRRLYHDKRVDVLLRGAKG